MATRLSDHELTYQKELVLGEALRSLKAHGNFTAAELCDGINAVAGRDVISEQQVTNRLRYWMAKGFAVRQDGSRYYAQQAA